MTIDKLLPLIIACISITCSSWAFYNWLSGNARKRIESERQLAHALNNFTTLHNAIGQLQEEIEQLTLEMVQVKTLMSLNMNPPTAGEITAGQRRRRMSCNG
jgi:hypothetical protein